MFWMIEERDRLPHTFAFRQLHLRSALHLGFWKHRNEDEDEDEQTHTVAVARKKWRSGRTDDEFLPFGPPQPSALVKSQCSKSIPADFGPYPVFSSADDNHGIVICTRQDDPGSRPFDRLASPVLLVREFQVL